MKQKNRLQTKSIVFKRWSGKRYAILQSLNRCLKIGVLSISYTLSTSTVKADDNNDTISTQAYETIDEVVVTGDAVATLLQKDAQVIEVISQHEIKSLPAHSLEDVLDYALNIDVRRRGVHGIQADIGLRGGTFDQTLILLNGINITDPQTGHFSMNIPFGLTNIKQIEIIKPGEAKLYGHGAFTGAVNIITEPTFNNSTNLVYSFGSYKTQNMQVQSTYSHGSVAQTLAGGYSNSEGYIENTDYAQRNMMYQGKYVQNNLDVNWQLGYLEKEFGANSFYTPVFPDQYESNRTILSGITASYGNRILFKPKIYWRRNYDHFILFREQPELYQNYHRSDVYGSNMQLHMPVGNHSNIITGYHYRDESIRSNNLGFPSQELIQIPESDSAYNKHYQRANHNLYLQWRYHHDKLHIHPLLSVNYNSGTKQYDLLPSLNIAYLFSLRTSFYANFDRSMRSPTFTDLFYQGPNNVGNTALQPEYAKHLEVGGKHKYGQHFFQTSFFYRQGTNIIDWMKESLADPWTTNNITTLNTMGFDLLYTYDVTGTTLPILDRISLSYSYTNIEKTSHTFLSHYALDNLRHKASTRILLAPFSGFTSSITANYQARNGSFDLYDMETRSYNEYNYEPFFIVDLKVAYQFRWTSIYAQANNLLDKRYFDIGNVIQPGRWVSIGLELALKY